LAAYVDGLHEEFASGKRQVQIYPGVLELFDELEEQKDVTLALRMRNIVQGAKAKLPAAGIDFSRFKINAFGSDHEDRPQLPAIAQQRARHVLGADISGDRL